MPHAPRGRIPGSVWGFALGSAFGLALLAAPGAARAAAAQPPPALKLSACELEHPLRLTVLAAECGRLDVAENPQAPRGRRIGLHVARIVAISRRKLPDPLFVLAGGPGQAATDFYAAVAGAFARILRERDIVLIDQRGTGGSNALDCAAEENPLEPASVAQISAGARACLAALQGKAEVGDYTTSLAVQDLERVRAALGYPRINLYGASYGTRVAQQYLRRFPQRVRSLILDGPVPVEAVLGAAAALDAEQALTAILARCAQQAPCRAAFGDPAQDYRAVRVALQGPLIPLTVRDPSSGAATPLAFGSDTLAAVLRLGSYSSEYAALLPLLLHAAGTQRDYAPLAAQYLLMTRAVSEALAVGMHNTVVCTEDVPFIDLQRIDRARLAATYMGTTQLDGLEAVCSLWPRGPMDGDLHAPLHSEVPALLLAGSADPVTPPAYARQAARSFAQSRVIELEGFGHGLLTAPCMDRVLADFVARAALRGLDTSCTARARPMPFFTSLNGPSP